MEYNEKEIRRQDRLLDEAMARELLKNGEYGVLSMVDGDEAYAVPVNYVWDGGEAIYIHCAPEGRKLRCIGANPRVSFCVVGATQVMSALFTTAYQSIVLSCRAVGRLETEERRHALNLILRKYSPADMTIGEKYAEKSFHRTEIIRLDVETWSGKAKTVK